MSQEAIIELFEAADDPLFVTHAQADFDGLGAAVALRELLDGRGTVGLPDQADRRASRLLSDEQCIEQPNPADHDLTVVLDAPSRERIQPIEIEGMSTPLVLLDHHEPDNLVELADQAIVDTEAGATSQLVYELSVAAGWAIPDMAGLALAVGFVDDTGFPFGGSAEHTKSGVSMLVAAGDRVTELPGLLDRTPEFGERVATARGVARADGFKAGNNLILRTRIGSHETATAHALRDAGADIALVLSERGDRTWVVGRSGGATKGLLDLPADLLRPLAREFGGDGGGHAGAGVAKLDTVDREAVGRRAIDLVETALGMTCGDMT